MGESTQRVEDPGTLSVASLAAARSRITGGGNVSRRAMMRAAGARAFQAHRAIGIEPAELAELGLELATGLARALAESPTFNLNDLRDLCVAYLRGWLEEHERDRST